VSLWAPGGDLYEQTTHGGPFAATEALGRVPSITRVLELLPGRRERVRLMRLRPGARILPHYDPMERVPDLVRVHVPLATNPGVEFRVGDRRIEMRPGEAWHIDVRFVHEVKNLGTDDRVHLVADLHRDEAIDALLASAEPVGQGRLVSYFVKQALPKRLRRALGLAN
ncbi:MAG TPA: aspartyl/asparaginyl beta-hydroxylase domain-containing protein, partial [Vicinamibacteria bacterium]|nr:aspartyl/asparaginyl beta-hydroxylase domain-containing protein [Vicinamibacteria bacterium]